MRKQQRKKHNKGFLTKKQREDERLLQTQAEITYQVAKTIALAAFAEFGVYLRKLVHLIVSSDKILGSFEGINVNGNVRTYFYEITANGDITIARD